MPNPLISFIKKHLSHSTVRTFSMFGVVAITVLAGCSSIPRSVYKINGVANQPIVVTEPMTTTEIVANKPNTASLASIDVPQYVAACFKQSNLNAPYMVGQVIQTPDYAFLTVGDNTTHKSKLCVVNKKTVQIEITSVSDLTYSRPTQN